MCFIDNVFKESENTTQVLGGSWEKDVFEKPVDDPLLLGKQITIEEAGETYAPSPSKQTKDQQHNAAQESDDDKYCKFIIDTIEKPMMDGYEDKLETQKDLQEYVMRHEKQILDFELKINNHHLPSVMTSPKPNQSNNKYLWGVLVVAIFF